MTWLGALGCGPRNAPRYDGEIRAETADRKHAPLPAQETMSIREPDRPLQAPGDTDLVPDLLGVEVSRNEDQVVVALAGELDIATTELVKDALDEFAQAPPSRLVIDLSRLSFLDSTGLAMFVALDKRCRENGGPALEIRPGPPPVQRLFELVGAANRLPFSIDGA